VSGPGESCPTREIRGSSRPDAFALLAGLALARLRLSELYHEVNRNDDAVGLPEV
jgi:hypothetical protein